MILGAAIGGLGLLILFLGALVLNGQRANRLQLRRLRSQVERAKHELRTPEERRALRRQLEEVEAQKRTVFGRYENAGG